MARKEKYSSKIALKQKILLINILLPQDVLSVLALRFLFNEIRNDISVQKNEKASKEDGRKDINIEEIYMDYLQEGNRLWHEYLMLSGIQGGILVLVGLGAGLYYFVSTGLSHFHMICQVFGRAFRMLFKSHRVDKSA